MRLARYRFFLLPLFFVLACVGAFAQGGTIRGIVYDKEDGEPVVIGSPIAPHEMAELATILTAGTAFADDMVFQSISSQSNVWQGYWTSPYLVMDKSVPRLDAIAHGRARVPRLCRRGRTNAGATC